MALTRDERQDLGVAKWKANKGRGIALYPTGFGKTRYALKIIQRYLQLNPNPKILIIVPHKQLQSQWIMEVTKMNLFQWCDVLVINTALKREYTKTYDILVADEIHMYASDVNIEIFNIVKFKFFIGLTATLSRLDGKESRLLKHFPIIDEITRDEAIMHEWVSDFRQIKVMLNVDLTEYQEWHSSFMHHFSFFDYNLDLGIKCLSDKDVAHKFHLATGQDKTQIMIQALGLMRTMSGRKNFCYDHPDKVDVANKIINSRLATGNKIITFTKTVDHAKMICCGDVYHGKLSKKKKAEILDNFNKSSKGVLHTAKALDVGSDVPGINIGIVLAGDSSIITKMQREGRSLRYEPGKVAELWYLVIKGTTEEKWFEKSNGSTQFMTVQDYDLDYFLDNGKVPEKQPNQGELLFVL